MIPLEQLQAGFVLPVDKPRQWTSFQAVGKVKAVLRNLYGIKNIKIGHAGTLDPLATGLLLVCIGKATKTIPSLQDADKVYTGTMVLGATTPCFDLEQAIDRYFPFSHISPSLLDSARQQFVGDIMQTPPLFSAVKVDGQRAYELARREDVPASIAVKPVHVSQFEITAFRPGNNDPLPPLDSPSPAPSQGSRAPHLYDKPLGSIPPALPQLDFSIHCGKGTYIRSLARDFGAALGSGAFLASLRRERVGHFSTADALPPEAVEDYLRNSTAWA